MNTATIIGIVVGVILVAAAVVVAVVLGTKKKDNKSNPTGPVEWVIAGADYDDVNTIGYSYDGISWDTIKVGDIKEGVAYGLRSNGTDPMWVAVGSGSNTINNEIVYSYDGICWSNGEGAVFSVVGKGVAFGLSSNATDTMWVAVGGDGDGGDNNIVYSYDGISWSDCRGAVFNNIGYGVAYGLSSNGTSPMWVATGFDSGGNENNIVYSYDGISWERSIGGGIFGIAYGVAYGLSSNGTSPMWVAVGDDRAGDDNSSIVYSYDGISWNDCRGAVFDHFGSGVAYGLSSNGTDPMWVAVGEDTNTYGVLNNIVYSYDGISWHDCRGADFDSRGYGVAYRSGTDPMWVAVGFSPGTSINVLYSYDGISWDIPNRHILNYIGLGVAGNKFNPALGAGWPNN